MLITPISEDDAGAIGDDDEEEEDDEDEEDEEGDVKIDDETEDNDDVERSSLPPPVSSAALACVAEALRRSVSLTVYACDASKVALYKESIFCRDSSRARRVARNFGPVANYKIRDISVIRNIVFIVS